MAKFYGEIGFAVLKETSPGVWSDSIVEYPYFGDMLKNSRRMQTADQLNDNINIANEISILADPFAISNFHLMRYVIYMGIKWKIVNVEVQHPRLNLSIGGIYNGEGNENEDESSEPTTYA